MAAKQAKLHQFNDELLVALLCFSNFYVIFKTKSSVKTKQYCVYSSDFILQCAIFHFLL